jgi:hypothetical protein
MHDERFHDIATVRSKVDCTCGTADAVGTHPVAAQCSGVGQSKHLTALTHFEICKGEMLGEIQIQNLLLLCKQLRLRVAYKVQHMCFQRVWTMLMRSMCRYTKFSGKTMPTTGSS